MRATLANLHPAIFARVMLRWGRSFGSELFNAHIERIHLRLKNTGAFSVNLPSDTLFFADIDKCYMKKKEETYLLESFYKKVFPNRLIELSYGAFLFFDGDYQNISPNQKPELTFLHSRFL